MKSIAEIMELKFSGENIIPENISNKELADLLVSVEDSLLNIIMSQHPDVNPDDIVIGLIEVQEGSAKFRFSSNLPALALSAFTALSLSITNNDLSSLPHQTAKSVRKIHEFTVKRNCNAEFRSDINSITPLATLSPASELSVPDYASVNGETTIYGKIERVGGVKPKVLLRLNNNRLLSCDVSEDIAKKMGNKLYSWVGVSGKAKWNTQNLDIDAFHIEKINDYGETTALSAFESLSDLIGSYWNGVDAIDAVEKLRG